MSQKDTMKTTIFLFPAVLHIGRSGIFCQMNFIVVFLLVALPSFVLVASHLRSTSIVDTAADEAITLGDTEYSSREEFYLTGARCRTKELREFQLAVASMPPEGNLRSWQ